MHITPNIPNNKPQNTCFKSRNSEIRALDGVCRKVINTFPVYSNTKLETGNFTNTKECLNLYRYTSNLIDEFRGFCNTTKSPLDNVLKTISGLKELKIGNCSEMATVTDIVCKLNGYENSRKMQVCAINKKTKEVRSLAHDVVGVNFTNTDKYEPSNFNKKLYFADNKSIVVDTWGGYADYSKNAEIKFKSNPMFEFKLSPDEEICYAPVANIDKLTGSELNIIKKKFPYLLMKPEKKSLWTRLKDAVKKKEEYNVPKFPMYLKENLKNNCHLRSALTREEIDKMLNESFS